MTNEHSKKMTGWEAAELDKNGTLYAEYDDDVAGYGVFGSESGHCYATFCGLAEAQEWAAKNEGG